MTREKWRWDEQAFVANVGKLELVSEKQNSSTAMRGALSTRANHKNHNKEFLYWKRGISIINNLLHSPLPLLLCIFSLLFVAVLLCVYVSVYRRIGFARLHITSPWIKRYYHFRCEFHHSSHCVCVSFFSVLFLNSVAMVVWMHEQQWWQWNLTLSIHWLVIIFIQSLISV